MLRVKLTVGSRDPVIRQSPRCAGVWDDVQFVFGDDEDGPFECWIVLEGLARPMRARCASGHVVFVTWEPPSIRGYDHRFLQQFSAVITFRTDIKHRNLIRSHPILPWWIGTSGGHHTKQILRDYDALKGSPLPKKESTVSVVCSDKAITEDHCRRLHFVRVLKERLGGRLQVFGPGFRAWPDKWPDKWDEIAPFQYHLALENSAHRDYWTEKVADAFLGGAFLIYWGCPNLSDYFPSGAFCEVNRDDPEGAAAAITKLLASNEYDKAASAIAAARSLILDRYNIFPELARYAKAITKGSPSDVRLREEAYFGLTPLQRVKQAIRRFVYRGA